MNNFPLLHKVLTGALLGALGLAVLSPNSPSDAATIRASSSPEESPDKQSAAPPIAATPTEKVEIKPSVATTTNLAVPKRLPAPAPKVTTQPIQWHTETIKAGDSLSLIFKRVGLNDRDIYELNQKCKEAGALKKIHPGQSLAFHVSNNKLQELRYKTDRLSTQYYIRNNKSFTFQNIILEPEQRQNLQSATIDSSLFLAGQKAGMSDTLIMALANIFGWDIDFALDIRKGDTFKVFYNKKYLDDQFIGDGPILAAEFTSRGKTYKAVRYTHKNGSSHYYTPEGLSMRKAFLRTPVDFARISSHFNLNRKHPVLNRIRAHKGTDYAAPRGTPIRAAGDGKIVHLGRKGGYGRAVIIKHGGAYKTLYAHMNTYQRGLRSGKRVKQGQIIGYVGSSGLATGPHLHYEFYVNGSVRNPVTVSLPKAKSIPKAELKRFLTTTKPQVATLSQGLQLQQLAKLDTEKTNRE
jgi:murein DD-endopeptidase MepM/ murein hydrolase activator NlpD